LHYVDEIAPEVKAELFSLTPHWHRVFGGQKPTETLRPNWPRGIGWLCTFKEPNEDSIGRVERCQRNLRTLAEITRDDRLFEVEEGELSKAHANLLADFHSFRSQYFSFIEKYHLDTDWLRHDLLLLLRRHAEDPTIWNSLSFASTYSYPDIFGDCFSFQFEPWAVWQDKNEYRDLISERFHERLEKYLKDTGDFFRDKGYKYRTKGHLIGNVKWLVLWNINRLPKEQILLEIKKIRPSTMTIDDLNSDFRKLETRYQLPYRREKAKKGKSKTKK